MVKIIIHYCHQLILLKQKLVKNECEIIIGEVEMKKSISSLIVFQPGGTENLVENQPEGQITFYLNFICPQF